MPFFQRLDQVQRCMMALLKQRRANTCFLLVNDGTQQTAVEDTLQSILSEQAVHIIHHPKNQGVAAARNTAIQWCRENDIELVLMIDSDCLPDDDFIFQHLQLHKEHPQAACFGCGVIGQGSSFWARLDKVMSWVHSVPYGNIRSVEHPYHLPTTNFSVKTSMLPDTCDVFDSRLRTGEDALLIRRFRKEGKAVLFSPKPKIFHFDREHFTDVFKHHYYWGHHQYFIQLNRDISDRSFKPFFRFFFLLAFIPCLPLFALLGATLNLKPWLRHKPQYILLFPFVLLIWLGKGVAVAEAAVRPHHCLRKSEL